MATFTAIAYSIISPIINGLACVAFILLFFAHKYLFVWVLDQPAWAETGGLFFPKAVDHVFVGLYLEQICLAALFFLARDEDGQVSHVRYAHSAELIDKTSPPSPFSIRSQPSRKAPCRSPFSSRR